jgi:hypothetical protein
MNVRRFSLPVLALVAAAGLPSTAHAEPVFAGFTCGYASVADPTAEAGVLTGTVFDYFYAGDTTSGPASAVTITCSIQVGNALPDAGAVAARASSTTPGPAGLLAPALVSFASQPGVPVFVCTEVTTPEGLFFQGDDDPGTAGNQCALVTSGDANGDENDEAQAEPWDREAQAGDVRVGS